MCDLFLKFNGIDFANYADNTNGCIGNTRIEVTEYLKDASVKSFWMVFKQSNEGQPWQTPSTL